MNTTKDGLKGVLPEGLRLRFLKPAQVKRIDDLLSQLGEYGEVHLVVQHGELRYINKVESYKAWKNDDES
jgi:hypothetical protein